MWIERHGTLQLTAVQLRAATVYQLIERVVTPLGLRVDRTSPLVDARLPDGSRVNVVVPPLAVDGPCITIRRFGARRIPLPTFCSPGVGVMLSAGRCGAGRTSS